MYRFLAHHLVKDKYAQILAITFKIFFTKFMWVAPFPDVAAKLVSDFYNNSFLYNRIK